MDERYVDKKHFSLYYYCLKPNHGRYACTKLPTCIDYLPT
jgi:hypothetical protein